MVDNKVVEKVVEEESEAKSWIGSAFSKTDAADVKVLTNYNFLKMVGGFGPKEVITAGVNACLQSKQFKEKAQAFAASIPK